MQPRGFSSPHALISTHISLTCHAPAWVGFATALVPETWSSRGNGIQNRNSPMIEANKVRGWLPSLIPGRSKRVRRVRTQDGID